MNQQNISAVTGIVSSSTSRRRFLGVGAAAAATVLLGACAGIPTSKNVHRYSDKLEVRENKNQAIHAVGPQEDAPPEVIIEGFIHAGVDSADNYAVARQFLTSDFKGKWNPTTTTRVYRNTAQVSADESSSGVYRARFQQTTLVSEQGLTSSFAETLETFDFKLRQIEGQWRIEACPDGLWLDSVEFDRVFSPYRLYFYNSMYTHAVPDIRWFAHRDGQLGILLQTVMGGPASYLKEVTASTLVEGMSLERAEVSDRDAKIHINGPVLNAVTRARLRQQVGYVLSNFSSVNKFELTYNGSVVSEDAPTGFQEAPMSPEISKRVVGLEDGKLVIREDYLSQQPETTGTESVTDASDPAINYDGTALACLGDTGRSLYFFSGGKGQYLVKNKKMTAPSFDSFGWLWVAESDGAVRAYNAASTNEKERSKGIEIPVSWRSGMTFSSLRISHDGARVVVVGTRDGTAAVVMSGVVRDSSGTPKGFTEPVRVTSSITPRTAVWAGEQNLVVVNDKTGESEVTTLSGEETKFDRLDGVKSVSAAGNTSNMLAHRSDGSCYVLEERGWNRLNTSTREMSFAG